MPEPLPAAKKFGSRSRHPHYSVAEAKLGEFLAEHRERVTERQQRSPSKNDTFGEALKIHQQNQANDVTIKPAARHYWNQIFVALLKSWRGLADREIRRVSKRDCKSGTNANERADEPPNAKVFRVGECQKALDRACKKVGANRITHHDLRPLLRRAASKAV